MIYNAVFWEFKELSNWKTSIGSTEESTAKQAKKKAKSIDTSHSTETKPEQANS